MHRVRSKPTQCRLVYEYISALPIVQGAGHHLFRALQPELLVALLHLISSPYSNFAKHSSHHRQTELIPRSFNVFPDILTSNLPDCSSEDIDLDAAS
jgi:hypothetical protein